MCAKSNDIVVVSSLSFSDDIPTTFCRSKSRTGSVQRPGNSTYVVLFSDKVKTHRSAVNVSDPIRDTRPSPISWDIPTVGGYSPSGLVGEPKVPESAPGTLL